MNNENTSPDPWEACPPGQLNALARRLRTRRRQRTLQPLAVVATAAVVMFVVGWYAIDASQPRYGGITCTDARSHAAAFLAKTLDSALTKSVNAHLHDCPHCQKYFEALQKSGAGEVPGTTPGQFPRRVASLR